MTDYQDAQQHKIDVAEAKRRPTAPCGHPAWDEEGHCAEMSCRFYVNKRQDVGTAATDYEVEQFASHMAFSEGTARQALAYLEEQGWTPPGVEPGERQRPGKFEDESEPRLTLGRD